MNRTSREDPDETRNLAADPAHHDLVARYNTLLEDLISAKIGTDTRARVTERPRLLGWPRPQPGADAASTGNE
ncbi:hypothetical protein [Streptomyces sp. NPDC029004]|uniref:hypothetical protein n=1 Tax=Streptomyces sp. NPDC029004 TaxID=3154490 RepID=UPI0033C0DF21